jgi:hypothetical protein
MSAGSVNDQDPRLTALATAGLVGWGNARGSIAGHVRPLCQPSPREDASGRDTPEGEGDGEDQARPDRFAQGGAHEAAGGPINRLARGQRDRTGEHSEYHTRVKGAHHRVDS